MADFEIAYKRTGIHEGGFTSNPDDNGNWTGGKKGVGKLVGTNWGISAPVYAAFLGRLPTMEEMKKMPKETAKLIYKRNYWLPIRGDEIRSQIIANSLYDMAVNSGVGTAIILLKREKKYPESGVMDNKFLQLINGNLK